MRATALPLLLLVLSCARVLPWRDEPVNEELNLAFTLEQNLIQLQSVRMDDREGRFILGSAAPRTVIDPRFALGPFGTHVLQIGQRKTVRIQPTSLDLQGVADGIVGIEPWGNRAISIDYRAGLVTVQKEGIHAGFMETFRYPAEPMIQVKVNGRDIAAIVDTTSPDTLVLPGSVHGRGAANVRIGSTDFGAIDVQYANVTHARVGNRLLSRYLVTIDYGRRVVGLWRDPRIPLEARKTPAGMTNGEYPDRDGTEADRPLRP
ncbi:MAG: hypothetical protein ACXW5U_28465 [Thermoanaerobaculia bacterium]